MGLNYKPNLKTNEEGVNPEAYKYSTDAAVPMSERGGGILSGILGGSSDINKADKEGQCNKGSSGSGIGIGDIKEIIGMFKG